MTCESLHRHAEPLDQVERVVGRERRRVCVLRQQQDDEDGHRHQDAAARQARLGRCRRTRFRRRDLRAAHLGIARARPRHQHHRHERHDRHPGDARLPARDDHHGGEQRPDRVSGMPADLEDALRKALLAGRRMARHARGFRMEHGRAEPDQRHRDEHHRVAAGGCEPDNPDQGRPPCPRPSRTATACGP